MRIFFAVILFAIIAIAIIVMVIINFAYRGIRKMREAAEDSYYIRQKRKEQKEKNPFGDDYFKSARTVKRTTRTTYRDKDGNVHVETTYSDDSGKNKTTRRTTTSGNVTIIDERPADKKIFEKGDDEYVEFEEVK